MYFVHDFDLRFYFSTQIFVKRTKITKSTNIVSRTQQRKQKKRSSGRFELQFFDSINLKNPAIYFICIFLRYTVFFLEGLSIYLCDIKNIH